MRDQTIRLLRCPACSSSYLEKTTEYLRCLICNKAYPIVNNIPQLITNNHIPAREKEILEANIKWHSDHAQEYETSWHTNYLLEAVCQNRNKEILYFIRSQMPASDTTLVDLGCGTGNILAISQGIFENSIGIDATQNMLEIAESRGLDVLRSTIYHIPLSSNTCDAVTCNSVIHHLDRPFIGYREIYRILKPGGFFYSDWDGNCYFAIKNLFYLWLCKFDLRFFLKTFIEYRILTPLSIGKSNVDRKNLMKAEAHFSNNGDWLNPDTVRDDLKDIGFTKVDIYYHWNSRSIFSEPSYPPIIKKAQKVISFINMSNEERYKNPFFVVLAQK